MTPLPIPWLRLPIHCNGRLIRPPMPHDQIDDVALFEICLRMHLIMDSVEYERAEGRLMNVSIFDSIDSLHDQLAHGRSPRLHDWHEMILHFGEYYQLNHDQQIDVTARSIESAVPCAKSLGLPLSLSPS